MKQYFALLLLPALALSSCLTVNAPKCGPDVACTMMFAAVTVEVRNATGGPMALERVELINVSDKTVAKTPQASGNRYTLIDDGSLSAFRNRSATFDFVGYREGRELFRERYVLGADCCHVKRISGKEVITLGQ